LDRRACSLGTRRSEPSGADAEACVVYATAYKDRAELAESVMSILPALVQFKFNRTIASAWFHPKALNDIDDTEFIYDDDDDDDDDGNWTGEWHTPDDATNQMIINEDIGFAIVLEGLDLMTTNTKHIFTMDGDASVQTFGEAFGCNAPTPPSQQDNSASTGNQ
jgi:hypothetical protein